MELDAKQKALGVAAGLLLVVAGVLIVRALLPVRASRGVELDERTKAGLRAAGSNRGRAPGQPEQGSMSDEEYARELIRLREEADARAGAGVESGSSRGSSRDGGG